MSLLIKSLSFTYLFILQYTIFAQEIQYIISGKVIDYATLEPLGYVSVTYLDINNQSILSGTVTDEDGTFVIHAPMSQGILEVSFLGYDKLRIQDIVFTSSSADVGVIQLVESKTMLEEVIVRAEKSSTEFKLDKRVFNVGTDLSATGANVLKVLNNIPSVNVNK